MKKVLIIFFFLISTLYSTDFTKMDAEYDVKFSIFGQVGSARAFILKEDGNYRIKIDAKAEGLAAIISNDRTETHESVGRVENGILIPDLYVKKKERGSKVDIKRYFFDHVNKKITARYTKIRDGEKKESNDILKFYAVNDILTLFFNLKLLLNDFNIKEPKTLYAVGGDKKDGHINILTPKPENLDSIRHLLGKDGNIITAIINQKIFASTKGELYLNLNEQGICTNAVLKDVILFGDIVGKIKNLDVE